MTNDKKVLFLGIVAMVVVAALNLAPNFDFLTPKAKSTDQLQPDVITSAQDQKGSPMPTVDELIIEDIQEGTGAEVKVGDEISIHYHGTLMDGTVFDSSVERGVPFETAIGVGQVIQGWDEGIIGLKVGGKRKLTIPAAKAYGNQANGSIPAGSTLVFEVELLEIK